MNTEISLVRGPESFAQRDVAPISHASPTRAAEMVGDNTTEGSVGVSARGGLDQTTADKATKPGQETAENLQHMVEKANEQAQQVRRNLEFSVDDVTNRTLIKVKDAETGEVIREIPPEDMMNIARSLSENSSSVLFKGQV